MTNRSELTCQELVELVTDYLEHALPPEDRVRFDAHLRECDPCVEYLAQMRATVSVVGRLPEEEIGPQVRQHLLGHFRSWKRSSGGGA